MSCPRTDAAMSHVCADCMAPLELEDGHNLCPSCLGIDHLKDGLSEDPCMNCRCMPWSVRMTRLRDVEQLAAGGCGSPDPCTLPAGQPGRAKRPAGDTMGAPVAKQAKGSGLTARVDQLSTELGQMKELLLALQPARGQRPPEDQGPAGEDAMSLAASATLFEDPVEDVPSRASGSFSHSSTRSSSRESEAASMGTIVRSALARLQLDVPQEEPAPVSAFFRRQQGPATLLVPPSADYIAELHACWRDSRALSHSTSGARALAAMKDADKYGLGRMPAVEPAIASLIVAPEETLRPDVRCPRPQCRVTDDLLAKAYDVGARMGRIGNSLSHLMLALSASLQQGTPDQSVSDFSDASLHAFALMTRELGRMMSTLVQARRQVWLAQSPLTDTCRRILRSVPVEPGQLFGQAALEALERTAQAGQTRQRLADLQQASRRPRTSTLRHRRSTRLSAGPHSRRQVAQQPPYRSERNKPERRLSQGPLSSIRAAIKRTSSRSSSQGDHARDRRRPEITILSAEPLVGNAWFPGGSGGFPPAPPPAQPIWGGSIPTAAQPPPSYDQVIKEKTQEQVPLPAPAPRHSTTIATQTDLLLDPDPECTASPEPAERKGPAERRALKPPRPSLPKPKPEPDNSAVLQGQPHLIPAEPPLVPDTSSAANQRAAEAQVIVPDHNCVTQSDHSTSSPAQCDETAVPFERSVGSVDSISQPIEADPTSSRPQRPIPLPRSKPNLQSISREVKVQTLVRIKDNGDSPQSAVAQGGLPSGKYLQELLDVFCTDDLGYQGDPSDNTDPSDPTDSSDPTDLSNHTDPHDQVDPSDQTDPSDNSELSEDDANMSVSHSQRSIKAKIHAFEKQSAMDAGDEAPQPKPQPRPRSQYSNPPAVAAKPSFNRRHSSLYEQINSSGSSVEKSQKEAVIPPTPAPRPMLAKASSEAEVRDVPATQAGKVPLIPPSRPSIMDRAKAFTASEEGPEVIRPTPPPKIKPVTDPVSLANHGSAMTLPTPPPKIKPVTDPVSLTSHGSSMTLPTPPPKIKPVADPVSLTNHGSAMTLPTPPPKIKPVTDPVSLANHGSAMTLPTPPPKIKPVADPVSLTNHSSAMTLPTPPPKIKPPMDPVPLVPPPRPSVMDRAKAFTASEEGPEVTLPTPPPKIKPATDPVSFANNGFTMTLPTPPHKTKPAVDPPSLTNNEHTVILPMPTPPPKIRPPMDPIVLVPPPRPSVMDRAKALAASEEAPAMTLPAPPPKIKPAMDPVSLTDHAPPLWPSMPSMDNGNADRPAAQIPIKPQRSVNSAPNPQNVPRRPTMIRVPSKVDEKESLEAPPSLPAQRPIGGVPLPGIHKPSISRPTHPPPSVEASNPDWFSFQPDPSPAISLPPRPSGGKVLPARPPPAKAGPGRPPPPASQGLRGPSFQAGSGMSLPPRPQSFRGPAMKGPIQPPRPKPGHPLYNKYTLEIPHAIAEFDYNGSNPGELSFQKNEVLVLLEQMDSNTFECQVGDAKGPVSKSYLKIITPLYSAPSVTSHQPPPAAEVRRGSSGLQAQALYDFTPEGPEELALKAGDLVSMVERVDDEWYSGTSRGCTGIFPVNFVRMLSTIPAPPSSQKAPPAPASISGPRCVARFGYDGDRHNELSFSKGDVIKLKEYIGADWARGEINGFTGIFPVNFVEVVEDLPPPPSAEQNTQKIALPGMVSASNNQESAWPSQSQPAPAGAEWVRARYDFTAESDDDLPFQKGAVILITEHMDAEWCRGRLDGREGFFPVAFVEPCPAPPEGRESQSSGVGGRARALFDFVPETKEELSLKAGDIITGVESIDNEWFLADRNGMRGLVPKNYVQVL